MPIDGTKPTGGCRRRRLVPATTDTTFALNVDNRGSVYGLIYNSCTDYHAWKWNPRQGSVQLASPEQKPDGTPVNTRINQVSANGETLVGWMEDPLQGIWYGSGVELGRSESRAHLADGEPVDEVTAVSGDGTLIGGDLFDGQLPLGDGYRRHARGGPMEFVQPLPGDAAPAQPFAMSWDGQRHGRLQRQPVPQLQSGAVHLDAGKWAR